ANQASAAGLQSCLEMAKLNQTLLSASRTMPFHLLVQENFRYPLWSHFFPRRSVCFAFNCWQAALFIADDSRFFGNPRFLLIHSEPFAKQICDSIFQLPSFSDSPNLYLLHQTIG